ncbi:MAG: Gfo/Idh/MocA family oxidoreductase [Lentisphaeria bacterium]|jgi:predicted dehydrogenase|nr:Gfo/Idh/MocA family oxidoreductase [Lentisphaeria bacterium]
MARLKIGFVGVGAMGQCAHLRNYALLGQKCEVAALAELRPELGRRVAARYGVPRVYPDAAAMLTAERLDALVASQPFSRHGVLLPELLAAGLPVFIEKPLASSVAVGERILAEIEARQGRVMVGYHKRCDPATVWLKTELERLRETGDWGRLTYVRLTMPAGDWIAGGFDDLIRTDDPAPALAADPPDPDLAPERFRAYTAFVNYYIHQVNLLRFLLGEDYAPTYAEPSGVLLAAKSVSGIPGVIEMSPYTTKLGWQESALVTFERGWLRLDLPAPLVRNQAGTVTLFDCRDGQCRRPQMPPEHAMLSQARHFLRFVRGEAPPPCAAAEALRDLRTAREYLHLL